MGWLAVCGIQVRSWAGDRDLDAISVWMGIEAYGYGGYHSTSHEKWDQQRVKEESSNMEMLESGTEE